MKALIKSFETRLGELTEQKILDLSKNDNSIFNVLRDLHNEAFGAYVWDDSKPNLDYYLTYVTKVNGKLEGFILKLQPHTKNRNELTTCFSAFICETYNRNNPHEVFNAYQAHQRSLFERLDYWTYGNELAKELKGKNGDLILKGYRDILFVPLADEPPKEPNIKNGLEKKVNSKTLGKQELQYVYIMYNKQNLYHKIGRSIKPEHREKTLQGQEPDVELIEKWAASAEVEKILHRKYKEKRKRGEWFDLTSTDIDEIKLFMQTIISKSK
ncbi:MAG: GIY-YIG nuclease family protein [Bacteroidetes bacterium]|nr:GIY-YIG nuclease family protein [Bacteroidota bacterium]HET6244215.1 GIY-YIG nuclease family protein [Bacteroidia bacterium]